LSLTKNPTFNVPEYLPPAKRISPPALKAHGFVDLFIRSYLRTIVLLFPFVFETNNTCEFAVAMKPLLPIDLHLGYPICFDLIVM
jgi:hypothetical protein